MALAVKMVFWPELIAGRAEVTVLLVGKFKNLAMRRTGQDEKRKLHSLYARQSKFIFHC